MVKTTCDTDKFKQNQQRAIEKHRLKGVTFNIGFHVGLGQPWCDAIAW